ncbi:hypothetical protein [Clostridium botulinum]|uniref:hypothetical protein n=1 Tax=Clostridium botulinum TaxID=1491 RepID=UPI000D12C053|nr:hypothetical protein [Clostridium botulinum]AVQ47678.1 hypothetical protein C7M60_18795 [Clostridium botulinum]AVQ51227.1 hypothetical protein C7M58_18785 [Clostridium botulinum]
MRNTSHSVAKHTRNFVNNHRREIEITRNVVTIASIAVLAIPAAPVMAIAALGIVEVGLHLAVGDNTSAAADLLCLFPMGKGIKYIGEIGGDAIKGGSKAKNLYKAEGLLKIDLQKFGKRMSKNIEKPIIGKERVGSALKDDFVDAIRNNKNEITKEFPAKAKGHGFPDIVDNYAGDARYTKLPDGADLYQLFGANNGIAGRFEWIVENGTINRRPILP